MPDDFTLPPYAYVPGQNERHPEDWFDQIKASVATGKKMEETQAWRAGLTFLEQGFFWECHEVLEAVWMAVPNPSPERDVTQAIIQLANAKLKLRMEKPRAVTRLAAMVIDLLADHRGTVLGIEVETIRAQAGTLGKMQ